jgi:hypothetical protein
MGTKQKTVVVLALVLCVGIAVLTLYGGTSRAPYSNSQSELSKAEAAARQTQSSTVSPATPKTEIAINQSLPSKYASARDFRVFFLESISKPESGGVFYAEEALRACVTLSYHSKSELQRARAATNAVGSNKAAVARLNAIDRLEARCSTFQPDELASLSSLQKVGLEKGDPLVVITSEVRAALQEKDAEKLQTAVSKAMATQDPFLVERIGMNLVVASSSDKAPMFKGKSLEGDDFRHFGMGMTLAVCQLGDACKANDVWADQLCGIHGVCGEGSRSELIRQSYGDDLVGFAKAVDFSTQIVSAVRSGDASAFVPRGQSKKK